MKLIIVFCLSFLISFSCFSQELIKDGSFEGFLRCPVVLHGAHRLLYWGSGSMASPDYFNTCNRGRMVGRRNYMGEQEPFHGKGYVGLVYGPESGNYQEYVRTKLEKKLRKNSLYCIRLYASLADYYTLAINSIEVGFTRSKRFKLIAKKKRWNKRKYVALFAQKEFLDDHKNWQEVKGVFKANGGERHLTIGYFSNNGKTKSVPVEVTKKTRGKIEEDIYYYIDNVSLTPISDSCECKYSSSAIDTLLSEEVKVDSSLKRGDTLLLEGIHFATGKSTLNLTSYSSLDKVLNSLRKDRALKLKIIGHTDNVGDKVYNQELSEKRARSVYDYFVLNKINSDRLVYEGKGSESPKVSNDTEENRAINRRVELIVY